MPENKRRSHSAPLWASQNFLTSGLVISRLLDTAQIFPEDLVLEIGPGKGHITRQLLDRCSQVAAIEADPVLCTRLRERFAGEPRFSLRQGDFL